MAKKGESRKAGKTKEEKLAMRKARRKTLDAIMKRRDPVGPHELMERTGTADPKFKKHVKRTRSKAQVKKNQRRKQMLRKLKKKIGSK